MELPISQEEDQGDYTLIPLHMMSTTTYSGVHGHIIHHGDHLHHQINHNYKTNNTTTSSVGYRECLKNHAAPIGGNATDGCGEFMPGGDDSLICSACNCHRKEQAVIDHLMMFVSHHHHNYMGGSDGGGGVAATGTKKKKRFRTKFSEEQKEKMMRFAERVGWRLHKQDQDLVHKFCQQLGITTRVFRVWMHNNKHNNLHNMIKNQSSIH